MVRAKSTAQRLTASTPSAAPSASDSTATATPPTTRSTRSNPTSAAVAFVTKRRQTRASISVPASLAPTSTTGAPNGNNASQQATLTANATNHANNSSSLSTRRRSAPSRPASTRQTTSLTVTRSNNNNNNNNNTSNNNINAKRSTSNVNHIPAATVTPSPRQRRSSNLVSTPPVADRHHAHRVIQSQSTSRSRSADRVLRSSETANDNNTSSSIPVARSRSQRQLLVQIDMETSRSNANSSTPISRSRSAGRIVRSIDDDVTMNGRNSSPSPSARSRSRKQSGALSNSSNRDNDHNAVASSQRRVSGRFAASNSTKVTTNNNSKRPSSASRPRPSDRTKNTTGLRLSSASRTITKRTSGVNAASHNPTSARLSNNASKSRSTPSRHRTRQLASSSMPITPSASSRYHEYVIDSSESSLTGTTPNRMHSAHQMKQTLSSSGKRVSDRTPTLSSKVARSTRSKLNTPQPSSRPNGRSSDAKPSSTPGAQKSGKVEITSKGESSSPSIGKCIRCDKASDESGMAKCSACNSLCCVSCIIPKRTTPPRSMWICAECHAVALSHGILLRHLSQLRQPGTCTECYKRRTKHDGPLRTCSECRLFFHESCARTYYNHSKTTIAQPSWRCKTCDPNGVGTKRKLEPDNERLVMSRGVDADLIAALSVRTPSAKRLKNNSGLPSHAAASQATVNVTSTPNTRRAVAANAPIVSRTRSSSLVTTKPQSSATKPGRHQTQRRSSSVAPQAANARRASTERVPRTVPTRKEPVMTRRSSTAASSSNVPRSMPRRESRASSSTSVPARTARGTNDNTSAPPTRPSEVAAPAPLPSPRSTPVRAAAAANVMIRRNSLNQRTSRTTSTARTVATNTSPQITPSRRRSTSAPATQQRSPTKHKTVNTPSKIASPARSKSLRRSAASTTATRSTTTTPAPTPAPSKSGTTNSSKSKARSSLPEPSVTPSKAARTPQRSTPRSGSKTAPQPKSSEVTVVSGRRAGTRASVSALREREDVEQKDTKEQVRAPRSKKKDRPTRRASPQPDAEVVSVEDDDIVTNHEGSTASDRGNMDKKKDSEKAKEKTEKSAEETERKDDVSEDEITRGRNDETEKDKGIKAKEGAEKENGESAEEEKQKEVETETVVEKESERTKTVVDEEAVVAGDSSNLASKEWESAKGKEPSTNTVQGNKNNDQGSSERGNSPLDVEDEATEDLSLKDVEMERTKKKSRSKKSASSSKEKPPSLSQAVQQAKANTEENESLKDTRSIEVDVEKEITIDDGATKAENNSEKESEKGADKEGESSRDVTMSDGLEKSDNIDPQESSKAVVYERIETEQIETIAEAQVDETPQDKARDEDMFTFHGSPFVQPTNTNNDDARELPSLLSDSLEKAIASDVANELEQVSEGKEDKANAEADPEAMETQDPHSDAVTPAKDIDPHDINPEIIEKDAMMTDRETIENVEEEISAGPEAETPSDKDEVNVANNEKPHQSPDETEQPPASVNEAGLSVDEPPLKETSIKLDTDSSVVEETKHTGEDQTFDDGTALENSKPVFEANDSTMPTKGDVHDVDADNPAMENPELTDQSPDSAIPAKGHVEVGDIDTAAGEEAEEEDKTNNSAITAKNSIQTEEIDVAAAEDVQTDNKANDSVSPEKENIEGVGIDSAANEYLEQETESEDSATPSKDNVKDASNVNAVVQDVDSGNKASDAPIAMDSDVESEEADNTATKSAQPDTKDSESAIPAKDIDEDISTDHGEQVDALAENTVDDTISTKDDVTDKPKESEKDNDMVDVNEEELSDEVTKYIDAVSEKNIEELEESTSDVEPSEEGGTEASKFVDKALDPSDDLKTVNKNHVHGGTIVEDEEPKSNSTNVDGMVVLNDVTVSKTPQPTLSELPKEASAEKEEKDIAEKEASKNVDTHDIHVDNNLDDNLLEGTDDRWPASATENVDEGSKEDVEMEDVEESAAQRTDTTESQAQSKYDTGNVQKESEEILQGEQIIGMDEELDTEKIEYSEPTLREFQEIVGRGNLKEISPEEENQRLPEAHRGPNDENEGESMAGPANTEKDISQDLDERRNMIEKNQATMEQEKNISANEHEKVPKQDSDEAENCSDENENANNNNDEREDLGVDEEAVMGQTKNLASQSNIDSGIGDSMEEKMAMTDNNMTDIDAQQDRKQEATNDAAILKAAAEQAERQAEDDGRDASVLDSMGGGEVMVDEEGDLFVGGMTVDESDYEHQRNREATLETKDITVDVNNKPTDISVTERNEVAEDVDVQGQQHNVATTKDDGSRWL